jgi:V-type H+-transporting ATPase subunit H
MIRNQDLELILRFDKRPIETQLQLLDADLPDQYGHVFLSLLRSIAKDEIVQYVLTLIDDVLEANPSKCSMFFSCAKSDATLPFGPFVRLLEREDWYTRAVATRIITALASSTLPDAVTMSNDDEEKLFRFLVSTLTTTRYYEYNVAIVALQKLLCSKDAMRTRFASFDGVARLNSLLQRGTHGFQDLYQIVFVFWSLTFNAEIAASVGTSVVASLVDVLKSRWGSKPKVARIVVAT